LDSASAHYKGCDGNPVPVRIKLDCCGEAEEHQLVIQADEALPSNDPCSHIFFPNIWVTDYDGNQTRDPKTPKVRCFLTPLDF
jgi:hypothetical protein